MQRFLHFLSKIDVPENVTLKPAHVAVKSNKYQFIWQQHTFMLCDGSSQMLLSTEMSTRSLDNNEKKHEISCDHFVGKDIKAKSNVRITAFCLIINMINFFLFLCFGLYPKFEEMVSVQMCLCVSAVWIPFSVKKLRWRAFQSREEGAEPIRYNLSEF